MHKCRACGCDNPESAKFCNNCGKLLQFQKLPEKPKSALPLATPNKGLRYLLIGAAAFLGLLILVSIIAILNQTSSSSRTPTVARQSAAGSSTLHRRMIGHWLEYSSHMHAFISNDAIVLKREEDTRLESYSYRVFSEDKMLSTLLLKVKQTGDLEEQSWEVQAVDYGQGLRLTIGHAHFSYVDAQTRPPIQ